MANRITIKKGLQIPLAGRAEEVFRGSIASEFVKVCPDDFHGIIPKLAVKVNDRIEAGNALFYDKQHPDMFFASPVSGVVTDIVRGEKRKILHVDIQADKDIQYADFGKKQISALSTGEIKSAVLEAGIWFLIKQRPYDIVANPDKSPRDIFVTGFDTAPLAPSYDFILQGQEDDLQTGFDALSKLTEGKVYLSISTKTANKGLREARNVILTEFEGPHPAGNVGVQSSAIIVQGLANDTLSGSLFNRLIKEVSLSLLNGVILASILFLGSHFLLNVEVIIGVIVTVALISVIIIASLIGTFVPILLDKFGIDPALATGPFITTSNDICGILIYFSIARLILGF